MGVKSGLAFFFSLNSTIFLTGWPWSSADVQCDTDKSSTSLNVFCHWSNIKVNLAKITGERSKHQIQLGYMLVMAVCFWSFKSKQFKIGTFHMKMWISAWFWKMEWTNKFRSAFLFTNNLFELSSCSLF